VYANSWKLHKAMFSMYPAILSPSCKVHELPEVCHVFHVGEKNGAGGPPQSDGEPYVRTHTARSRSGPIPPGSGPRGRTKTPQAQARQRPRKSPGGARGAKTRPPRKHTQQTRRRSVPRSQDEAAEPTAKPWGSKGVTRHTLAAPSQD
jgi:hypothetical protein